MDWNSLIRGFEDYLMLERSLSPHSIDAYVRDIKKVKDFVELRDLKLTPLDIQYQNLEDFVTYLFDLGVQAKSQARIISGVRAFYKYLLIEDLMQHDPSELLEGPKLGKYLPDTLSYEEINLIIKSVDHSTDHGQRNRAILETLYSCGLRVSELTSLRLSHYYPDQGFIRVIGKNNKERLIPIGDSAIKYIRFYLPIRNKVIPKPGEEDYLFLNRRGSHLSRIMIFNIVKDAVKVANIDKVVSPHTFRHSFASHMVDAGADLRSVQDMLGHESITTTEIYTHIDTQHLRDAIMTYHPSNRN